MVLQHQVYATGNCNSNRSSASSKVNIFIPQTRKEYLEQHVLKKREAEVKRTTFWNNTSNYYSKVTQQSEKFNDLTCPEVRRASIEASHKEKERENRKTNLLVRRNKLKVLYAKEKEMYSRELDELPLKDKNITDFRRERELMRKERENILQKEAELKMLQHWKINNPVVRDAVRSRDNIFLRKQLEEQIALRKEEEEKKREEERIMQKLLLEEDQRKQKEMLLAEEERQKKMLLLKKELEDQMHELREREREMDVWRRAREEQQRLQEKVRECEEERKRLDKVRDNRELQTYQKRQHRLKLKMKTKQVQEDLQADKQKLEEMEKLSELQDGVQEEKKRKAIEEVKWMRNVLEQQQIEEQKREKELELMFAEEAEKMWSKQEEIWEREAKARRRLMDEVASAWEVQHQERLKAATLVEEEELKRVEELKDDLQRLNLEIQEQSLKESRDRVKITEAWDNQIKEKQFMERRAHQDSFNDEMRLRQEEIREENKLARELANMSTQENPCTSVSI